MKRVGMFVLLVVLVPGYARPAEPPVWKAPTGDLGEARTRWLKGNFAEARSKYESLLTKDATRAVAAIGISRTWRAEGEYEKAESILSDTLKTLVNHPDLLAERGDLRYVLGRWDDAVADAEAAIKQKPEHFLAHWVRARHLRDKGDLEAADREMRWFVRTYTARSNADKDVVDPEELMLIAQAGAENARWHRLPKQFSFILNEMIKDALKADPNYWPAEWIAGDLLLEKYNRPDALDAFEKALAINPKATEAIVGKGHAALQKFELKDAEQFADEALKINPRHPTALMLKADVLLMAGDFTNAEKRLVLARAVNPRDAFVLGRMVACLILQGRVADTAPLIKEAETYDSKPADFYTTLASVLEDRKKYVAAEGYYQRAAQYRPLLPAAPLGLGMLALRMGKEAEAKEILSKAFTNDPFNVRARNSLEVLKHLDKYATLTTPHYIIRYDEKTDRLLAEFVAEYLEELHAELKRQFGAEPPGKTLVQIFNSHEMFSGRVVGLPDLHTIGACTGPLFAMASPRAKGVRKPFNWGRVVRHELTHVFNLTQTDYQCPHWLTEGLAVRNEQMARPPAWAQALRDKYRANELFTLESIQFGFVRPRGPDEWALAYCQSQLYVDYLVKQHGEAAIAKLLAAFKTGAATPAAIQIACGVDVATFEKGYKAYVDEAVKPYLATKKAVEEKAMTFAELEEAIQNEPDNLDLAARYAEQLARRNKPADARRIVDMVLSKAKGHPTASLVKARLLHRAGEVDAAQEILEAALKEHADDARLLFAGATMMLESDQTEHAAELLERGRKIAPLDADWLGQLSRIYTKSEQTDKLLDVLREICAGDPDELDGRMKLARAALAAGKLPDAERYAREAAQIEITNPDVQKLYVEVLQAAGKGEQAGKLRAKFGIKDD